jgi:hypothetical protein
MGTPNLKYTAGLKSSYKIGKLGMVLSPKGAYLASAMGFWVQNWERYQCLQLNQS